MSSLDVEKLLEPVSPDQPCGENLEYDADFGELERAAQSKPDQEYGNTKVEAEPPDWRSVRDQSIELFGRTKDLRVALFLARSAIHTDGLSGFRDALSVVRSLVEQHWKELHPQLDPDDDLDPVLRVNTLITLCDKDACLWPLTEATLVDSALGQVAFRDFLIAMGELPPRSGQEPMDMSAIELSFTSTDADAVLATQAAARGAAEDAASIEATVTQEVGIDRSVSLDPLTDLLRRIVRLVDEQVKRLGIGKAVEEDSSSKSSDGRGAAVDIEELGDVNLEAAFAAASEPAFDSVKSREDVIRLIDKICDYYREYEPSSPVPMLLRRAKRVATMDFMELLRELAPGGLAEVELLKGSADGEYGES